MENLRISGDDDSPGESRPPGRSFGRGRNIRPTNQTSARDIQLQNQFQREVREEEQQRARIEALSRANQRRLVIQFQREQDEANASARHVPTSARDVQVQNQYRQELREAERQRARQEARTAAEQQHLNARYQREREEEQRRLAARARAHNTQTGALPKTAGSSTEPAAQTARDVQMQNEYRQAMEDQIQRSRVVIQQQREYADAQIRRAEEQLSHARMLTQQAEAQRNQCVRAHMTCLGPRMAQDQSQAQRSGAAMHLHAPHMMRTQNPTEQCVLQCPIAVVQPVMYAPTPIYSYVAPNVHQTTFNFRQFQELNRNAAEEEWEEEGNTVGWRPAAARNVNPSATAARDEVTRNAVEEEWSEGEGNTGGWGAAAAARNVNPSATAAREEVNTNVEEWFEGEENAGGYGAAASRNVNPSASVGRGNPGEDDDNSWPEDRVNEMIARARAIDMDPEVVAAVLANAAAAAYESNVEYIPAGAEDDWSDEERPVSTVSTEEETGGDTEAPTEQGSLGRCLVCLHRPRSTMFLDCGHISCCQKCSSSLRTCPTCRAVIRKVQRAYLP